MDQVKVFLRQLKKHHFWVLVALAALVGFICWWSGAGALAAATKTNEEIVKKSFADLQDVDKSTHPANQQFAEGVNAKNDELKQKVLAEWQGAYDAQQKTFHWPELVAERLASLKPDETDSRSHPAAMPQQRSLRQGSDRESLRHGRLSPSQAGARERARR